MKRTVFLLGACVWALASPGWSAPCAGFTDVDSASGFCPNVEWLKNRSVTLGCTSATLYCPTISVSRLSMAAFMNRLGTSLTATIAYQEQGAASLDLDTNPLVCQTAPQAIGSYPRSAHVRAAVSARVTTAVGIALVLMQSVNGNAWTAVNSQPATIGGSNRWLNLSIAKAALPQTVGTSVRYGVAISRFGGGTADLANWNCQLEAAFHSRTGTSSPF